MFLVDDSNSMKAHQSDVATAVRVLSKLVKVIVPRNEKITLEFASNYKDSYSETKSSRLARIVRARRFCENLVPLGQHLVTNLENITKTISQEVSANILKPRSIYVLTDGLWKTKGRETDIQAPIIRLMDEMVAAGALMKDVSITIIRFTLPRPDKSLPEGTEYIDFNDLVIQLRQHKGISK